MLCVALECLKLAENESERSICCLLFDHPLLLGEGASPFIDEGDGLTSERECVCVLPSLVAHTVGYKMVYRHLQYY